MTETHAVTDDYGRRLYTVTTVTDEAEQPVGVTALPYERQVDHWNEVIRNAAAQLRALSERGQVRA